MSASLVACRLALRPIRTRPSNGEISKVETPASALSLSFGFADQSQLAFSHSPRLLILALQLPSFWLTGATAGFRTSAGLSTEFSLQLHHRNLSYENHNQSVTMGCGMSTEEKEDRKSVV